MALGKLYSGKASKGGKAKLPSKKVNSSKTSKQAKAK